MNKRVFHSLIYIGLLSACTNGASTRGNTAENEISVENQEHDSIPKLNFKSGVRCIFEDGQGNFWFGSHQDGVAHFNGKTFEYFTMNDGLSDNQIRSIQEDQAGHIWFGTGNGIMEYDGQNFTIYADKTDLKTHDYLGTIDQINPNDLWFPGTENTGPHWYSGQAGAYRYDGAKLTYLPFPVPTNLDPTNPLLVTSIAKGRDNVWFGTYPAVLGFDGTDFTLFNEESFQFTDQSGVFHVRAVFEDSAGNLWIGNNGVGVLKWDGKNHIQFTSERGLSRSKSSQPSLAHVFVIAEDHQGNIWFGDRDTGAWRYNPKLGTSNLALSNYPSPMIWDIYTDRSGQLWFALEDGSVRQFDGEALVRVY